MLSLGIRIAHTIRCNICGYNMDEQSNKNLSYLDYNVRFIPRGNPDGSDRIRAAILLGWCPICAHNLQEAELEKVAETAAKFYASQKDE